MTTMTHFLLAIFENITNCLKYIFLLREIFFCLNSFNHATIMKYKDGHKHIYLNTSFDYVLYFI